MQAIYIDGHMDDGYGLFDDGAILLDGTITCDGHVVAIGLPPGAVMLPVD